MSLDLSVDFRENIIEWLNIRGNQAKAMRAFGYNRPSISNFANGERWHRLIDAAFYWWRESGVELDEKLVLPDGFRDKTIEWLNIWGNQAKAVEAMGVSKSHISELAGGKRWHLMTDVAFYWWFVVSKEGPKFEE